MYINIEKLIEDKMNNIKDELKKLSNMKKEIKLAVIIANDDASSRVYVNSKRKMCESLGIKQEEYFIEEGTTTEDICSLIRNLNEDESVTSILLQLPVYSYLDITKIIECISPKKDVDGFTLQNVGKLFYMQDDVVIPCTPKGILSIIKYLNIDVEGKQVCIIGRSNIVGKPLEILLVNMGATVSVLNSHTKNLKQNTILADILISAAGQADLVKADMVKKDAIVIDVGINKMENGKITGDVSKEAKEITLATKVPGGVGKMTVISLIENIIQNAKENLK